MALNTNTVLLLNCDGSDTSTTFTDASDSEHTVTAVNQAQVDTSAKKFGTGALLLDGNDDRLSVPISDDWKFGTGQFTFDCWVKTVVVSTDGVARRVVQHGATSASWMIFVGINGYVSGGFSAVNIAGPAVNIADGDWHHLAITRNSSNYIRCFVDGVSGTAVSSTKDMNVSSVLIIGAHVGGTTGCWNGSIDEIRVLKGEAAWTANFTPPTSPYVVAGSTGTAAQTAPFTSQSATGQLSITGQLSATAPSTQQDVSGVVITVVVGTAAQTAPTATQAAEGNTPIADISTIAFTITGTVPSFTLSGVV